MRLFKPSTVETDDQVHQYTKDIESYAHLIQIQEDTDTRELMESNLKVMLLVQSRLLEGRG